MAPAQAPAPASPRPARPRDPASFKPLDEEQYDIPAFLRRGSPRE